MRLYFQLNLKKCLHAFTLLKSVDYKLFTCEGAFTHLHTLMSSKNVKAREGTFTRNKLINNELNCCEGVKALFDLNIKKKFP